MIGERTKELLASWGESEVLPALHVSATELNEAVNKKFGFPNDDMIWIALECFSDLIAAAWPSIMSLFECNVYTPKAGNGMGNHSQSFVLLFSSEKSLAEFKLRWL